MCLSLALWLSGRGLDTEDFEKVAAFFDRAVELAVELKVPHCLPPFSLRVCVCV